MKPQTSRLALFGRLLSLMVAVAGFADCASLPDRSGIDIPHSRAIVASAETGLGTIAHTAIGRAGSASAFKLLPLSNAAYETRIELVKQAERSPRSAS